MKKLFVFLVLLLIVGCDSSHSPNERPQLLVAAAANLTEAFGDVGQQFTMNTGIPVVFSFGATADLATQIENGAPFDVFVAADLANVDRLEKQGLLTPGSKAIYARGRLVLWLPPHSKLTIQRIEDITSKDFQRIAVAKPDIAPYGQATVDSLRSLGIWDQIEPRVVYGQNVAQTKQFAATGNAEAAFIPLALVKSGEGNFLEINEDLHHPLDQALGIVKDSANQTAARQFVDFLLGSEGQDLLFRKGYSKSAGR
jgi:molybdate transport system substrate-binding protein